MNQYDIQYENEIKQNKIKRASWWWQGSQRSA